MSTGFAVPAIERKPDSICVGRISEITDAAISKSSGKYYVCRITLEPLDAGVKQSVYFCFRPEWLGNMTEGDLILLRETDSSAHFTYMNNIASSDSKKPSLLQSLTFSTNPSEPNEAFVELATRLLNLGVDNVEKTPTLVSDELRKFFIDERGENNIGYVVGQQTKKSDSVHPETGKAIYVPTKYTEVAYFFEPTDKNLAKQTKKAEDNPLRYRMTFAGAAF